MTTVYSHDKLVKKRVFGSSP